jgi:hypothetical protein
LGFIHPEDENYIAPVNQNLKINFMQLHQPFVDPMTSLVPHKDSQPCPEALHYWVKFFSNRSPASSSIIVLDNWMSFFTFLQLQSPAFDWAKEFLQISAWDLFSTNCLGKSTLFSIPSACPSVNLSECSNFKLSTSVVLEELDPEDSITKSPATPSKLKRGPNSKAHHL